MKPCREKGRNHAEWRRRTAQGRMGAACRPNPSPKNGSGCRHSGSPRPPRSRQSGASSKRWCPTQRTSIFRGANEKGHPCGNARDMAQGMLQAVPKGNNARPIKKHRAVKQVRRTRGSNNRREDRHEKQTKKRRAAQPQRRAEHRSTSTSMTNAQRLHSARKSPRNMK